MMSSSLFNVGRYAEKTICACDISGGVAAAEVLSLCARCSRIIPYDLSLLSYTARVTFLESVKSGKALTLHGHNFIWSVKHERPSTVLAWRGVADPLADAALAELGVDSCDAAKVLAAAAAEHHHGSGTASSALLSAMDLPPWADAAKCRRGGEIWFVNAPTLGPCLLGLSLLGGFGSSAINETLVAAGGLTGSRDRVHRRLIETLQFVNDVCSGSLERGGQGWRAILDVRMLHARVRARIRHRSLTPAAHESTSSTATASCPFGYTDDDNESEDKGEPVSAGDIVATQLAFSLVMLMGAERAGLAWHLSDEDVGAVIHLWGVIGTMMGATHAAGMNEWAAKGDLKGAMRTLESLVVVLASPGVHTRPLVLATARAAAWRLPFLWSPADQIAVASALAGSRYAHALGLPSLDDPSLTHVIDDAAPTTAFTTELLYVRTNASAYYLAVDGAPKEGSSLRVIYAPIRKLVGVFLRTFKWCLLIFSSTYYAFHPLAQKETKAVRRGLTLLAPLRIWSMLVWFLPLRVQRKLAAVNEAALKSIVSRRLRGRALYA